MKPFDGKTPTMALGATEADVRRKLDAGEPVVFPDGDPGQRVIQAEWITKLDVPIRIGNAVIRGPLAEPFGEFKAVSLVNCELVDEVNVSNAKFAGGLNLRGSRFYKRVLLAGIDVNDDLRLTDAVFHDQLNARDAHIGQLLVARGAAFHGTTLFNRLTVDKAAFFEPQRHGHEIVPTRFFGDVFFIDAKVSVTAVFNGVYFGGLADFVRMEVGAEAFFQSAGEAYDSETDNLVQIEEKKQPAVIFKGNALFRDAHFKAVANFNGASFDGEANFVRMRVGSDALFSDTSFKQWVSFSGAIVGADFFLVRAKLGSFAEMVRMNITSALILFGAQADEIGLLRSRLGILALSDPNEGNRIGIGKLNCDGTHFERFAGDWRRFLRLVQPFSRDPYDALERHLRAAGDENHARDVYFERRKRQGQELRKRAKDLRDMPRAWLLDPFERFISRYGVRSFGLFAATIVLIALGVFVFTRDGALEPKPPNVKAAPSTEEAVVYSVALVIPLVQLPPIDRWRPSANAIRLPYGCTTMSFETFSAIYRLAGFLFVPLAVAVLTGLLYRRDRT